MTALSSEQEIQPDETRDISIPTRITLPTDDLSLENMQQLWKDQERYLDHLEEKLASFKDVDDKVKMDNSRREHLLVMRLTAKEQEIQELAAQVAELKGSQAPTSALLRNTLLDPAVNLLIQKLTKECENLKKQAEDKQNELAAWKFTPDSATGKRLMAKCRQLYQENEDLGKMISSGRLAKLEGELALQKNLSEEMKKNQLEMDDFMTELDEDVEGMQSTILLLQQQLREANDKITQLTGGESGKEDKSDDSKPDQDVSDIDETEPVEDNVNTDNNDELDKEDILDDEYENDVDDREKRKLSDYSDEDSLESTAKRSRQVEENLRSPHHEQSIKSIE